MSPTVCFKSLSDETRLKCVLLIMQHEELCVCELMAALNDIQPKISRHLAKLRQNGLLVDRRQGQWVYYRINPELPEWACQVLAETSRENQSFIKQEQFNLLHMQERPIRE
ncbi:metalloregulator ArsR/SmtB family transcription factor [Shewanella gelidii]|uniref:metalloregulator ArsR/SmtB family transcription factor n=1 Tax=Shewanella gelidii TaxID=1642821 RepID=UPI0035711F93